MAAAAKGVFVSVSKGKGEAGKALLIAGAGFVTLSLGDAVVKTMAGEWPATGVAMLRYSAGALGLGIAAALFHGREGLRPILPWIQLGRGASVALATISFFLATYAMPLADATSVQFTNPMLTALLSALILGEKAPRAVWGASVLAFLGVLVVLRPNLLELGATALLPLGSAFGMAWLMIFNRKCAGAGHVLTMQFLVSAVAAVLLTAIAIVAHMAVGGAFTLSWPSLGVLLKCLLVATTASTAHLLIYVATTKASAAVVAPMTYVQLLAAVGLGWLWFGDHPDLATLGGAAMIVGSGLWLWNSQRDRDGETIATDTRR